MDSNILMMSCSQKSKPLPEKSIHNQMEVIDSIIGAKKNRMNVFRAQIFVSQLIEEMAQRMIDTEEPNEKEIYKRIIQFLNSFK